MKRILFTLALPLGVALMAFNQTGCQPAAEPVANNTPAVARETPPDTAAIEREITRIENDWPRVLKERDVEAVRRIEADDLISVPPDGSLSTKEQDLKDIGEGNMTADSWEVKDLKVTVLGADAAVASGRAVIKGGKYKTADGKSRNVSGQYRFVDTFARRNSEWKLVATVIVPVLNPVADASPTPIPKASPATTASPAMKTSPATTASPAMKASPATTKPSPGTKAPPPPPAATP